MGSATSSTRAVYAGGATPSTINVIEYITMASTGNGTDFGDLTIATQLFSIGVVSSPTKGIFAGGSTGSTVNTIHYVEIATTGNALEFGDLTIAKYSSAGICGSHGGIS